MVASVRDPRPHDHGPDPTAAIDDFQIPDRQETVRIDIAGLVFQHAPRKISRLFRPACLARLTRAHRSQDQGQCNRPLQTPLGMGRVHDEGDIGVIQCPVQHILRWVSRP